MFFVVVNSFRKVQFCLLFAILVISAMQFLMYNVSLIMFNVGHPDPP